MPDSAPIPEDPDRLATTEQFGRYLATYIRGLKTQRALSRAIEGLTDRDPTAEFRNLPVGLISRMENLRNGWLPDATLLRSYVHGSGKAEHLAGLERARRRIERSLAEADRERERAATGDLPPGEPINALPPAVGTFTGRADELERLQRMWQGGSPLIGAARVFTIDGMGGVGKSAFAVYAAYRLSAAFPDGQIFLRLHGHSPGIAPVDPHQALATLLLTIGVEPRQLSSDPETRIAQWLSRTRGKRLLLVLDDAADADQVRTLIPAEPGALVLITSRRRLRSLEGAEPISLGLLPPGEAAALLTLASGRPANSAERDVSRITALCGYLPLALQLAASRLKHHSAWTVADVADQLADGPGWTAKPPVHESSVAAAVDLSYRDLGPEQQRLLRRIAVHPGADLDVYAAAALGDFDALTAGQLLEDLEEHRLIDEPTRGRYRMHDLIREYAQARTASDIPEPDADRDAALDRLFDYYLHTAACVAGLLYPFDAPLHPEIPASHTPVPRFADGDAARKWFAAEQANVLATAAYATAHGRPRHAVLLSKTLWRHFEVIGHYQDAMSLHRHALDAARALRDGASEGRVLSSLGAVHWQFGRYAEALDQHKHALSLVQEANDRPAEGQVLQNLGIVYWQLGRFREAVDCFQQALAVRLATGFRAAAGMTLNNLAAAYVHLGRNDEAVESFRQAVDIEQESNNRLGEGVSLGNLAFVYARLGRYDESIDHSIRALAIHREIANRPTEGYALGNLGLAYERLDRFAEAEDHLKQALALLRDCGDRPGEAGVLSKMGVLYERTGRHQDAAACHRAAVASSREIGDEGLIAETLNQEADTLCATGAYAAAELRYSEALAICRETGALYEQARALAGLARTRAAAGARSEALILWREALDHYTTMGVPEADALRAYLRDL